MTRILITGISGFIAHHLTDKILKDTDCEIVGLYKDDKAGSLEKLKSLDSRKQNQGRVKLLWCNLRSEINDVLAKQIGQVDYIYHLGALTHVDRSIINPMDAIFDNVVATGHILEFARKYQVNLIGFNYFSTDEVFGSATQGYNFKEEDKHNPGNPYSAGKSGGEMMCKAYVNTYKMPIFITHTMNVFGERQHPEKFIPLVINKVLKGEELQIHSYPDLKKAGTRFYIYASNVADVLLYITDNFQIGESYNIVGEKEIDNLTLAQTIADIIGKPLYYKMVDFHSARPGHDLRYALDGTKIKDMGYKYPDNLESSLEKTIKFYLDNPSRL